MNGIGAPFQLLDYHVETLTLERLHPETEGDLEQVGTALGFGMEIRPVEEVEEDVYDVELDLHINDDEEAIPEEGKKHIFHRVRLVLIGRFQWSENAKPEDENEADRRLLVEGLPMLYGVARVHLRQLTDPGPEPVLHLPTVHFQSIMERTMQEGTEE